MMSFRLFRQIFFALSAIIAGRILHKPVVIRDAVIGGIKEQDEFLLFRYTRPYIIKNGRFVALSKMIASDLESRGVSAERITHIPIALLYRRAIRPPGTCKKVSSLAMY